MMLMIPRQMAFSERRLFGLQCSEISLGFSVALEVRFSGSDQARQSC